MAVTWIGVIKEERIDRAIDYVANPDKTAEKSVDDGFYSLDMEYSIRYALNPDKDVKRLYRTAINCTNVENVYEEMMATKRRFGKTKGGAQGFHLVQSFAPGEIEPELAHKLGCELVRRCFMKYEALVGTHLDKAHIHNHIIINTVSFVDGRKYHSNKGSYYYEIRKTSDDLCREHGLSVLPATINARGKIPYFQYKAEKEGKPTWDTALRSDVDYALSQSRSFEQWVYNMRHMGYLVKTNVTHLAVRPPGKQKFVRLRRLGEDYTEAGIRRRIKENLSKKLPPPEDERQNPTSDQYRPKVRRVRYKGKFSTRKKGKATGFMALYLWYAYRMGNKRTAHPNNRRMHYLLREDLRKMDQRMAICSMLEKNKIESYADLEQHEARLQGLLSERIAERKKLHKRVDRAANQGDIDDLSEQIRAIRKELKLVEFVRMDAPELQEKKNRLHRETERALERQPQRKYPQQRKNTRQNTTHNRIVCFDIHELGQQLKPIGMLVVLDAIYNRIARNRAMKKNTWIYIDEIYLMFRSEYSSNFLFELWKRVRKYGAFCTGISQNIEDLLQSHVARAMLGNSEFLVLLNQSASDRAELSRLLNISGTQLNYITNAEAGTGLIKCGGSIIPFESKFPMDNKLYGMMTTKLNEQQ